MSPSSPCAWHQFRQLLINRIGKLLMENAVSLRSWPVQFAHQMLSKFSIVPGYHRTAPRPRAHLDGVAKITELNGIIGYHTRGCVQGLRRWSKLESLAMSGLKGSMHLATVLLELGCALMLALVSPTLTATSGHRNGHRRMLSWALP